MITAVHTLIYSDDPKRPERSCATSSAGRRVQVPDSSPPWPIFKTGPSELGVHPTSGGEGDDAYSSPRHHSISLMCDDIDATKADLEAKGATFTTGIVDYGFGLAAQLDVPGAGEIMLYEPRHPTAFDR